MMNFRSVLTVAAVLLIVACGGSPESTQAQNPAEDTASAPDVATTSEPEVQIVEESVADPADTPTAAEERIVLAEAEAEAGAGSGVLAESQFKEGEHYTVLTTAQGTSSSPDVVEVAEVFWYGCPHCYTFDPYVDKWAANLPDGTAFVRLPVMWNPTNQIHARMFYTAEVLGKLDEMHEAIFKQIHVNKKTLTTESDIEEFFVSFDVSPEEFKSTFRSFPVETKLNRAKNLTQRYRVQSVPVLVVNGKYVTTGKGIRNFDDMLAVGDELIAREAADR